MAELSIGKTIPQELKFRHTLQMTCGAIQGVSLKETMDKIYNIIYMKTSNQFKVTTTTNDNINIAKKDKHIMVFLEVNPSRITHFAISLTTKINISYVSFCPRRQNNFSRLSNI